MNTQHRAIIVAALAALIGGSCASQPRPPAERPSSLDQRRSELDVQALVMKMADDYSIALTEAMRPIIVGTDPDPAARASAQWILRNGTGSAIDIAVGPNPDVALLDMLVLVSLHRWSLSEHGTQIGIPEQYLPQAARRMEAAEASAWRSASTILSNAQEQALRSLIDSWIRDNPHQISVAFVRFEEFLETRHDESMTDRAQAQGLLREVSEATASVESARLLGERGLWYAARYPYVLGQQAAATLYEVAYQPEYRSAMATLNSLKDLGGSLASRAESLDRDLAAQQQRFFEKLTAERETAVTQTFDRLAKERKEFLDDLESREGKFRESIPELRATISSTAGLAKELTGTAEAIDRIVARFDQESRAHGTALDITKVRDAAAEAASAAANLTVLLERTNELAGSPVWDQRLARLDNATTGLIDRAFWRGALLVLALIAGLALVRLVPQRTRVLMPARTA